MLSLHHLEGWFFTITVIELSRFGNLALSTSVRLLIETNRTIEAVTVSFLSHVLQFTKKLVICLLVAIHPDPNVPYGTGATRLHLDKFPSALHPHE